jgi:hypothetical protein
LVLAVQVILEITKVQQTVVILYLTPLLLRVAEEVGLIIQEPLAQVVQAVVEQPTSGLVGQAIHHQHHLAKVIMVVQAPLLMLVEEVVQSQ